jgi:hypothetical protein
MGPTLVALRFAGPAHAQGTMVSPRRKRCLPFRVRSEAVFINLEMEHLEPQTLTQLETFLLFQSMSDRSP